MSEENDFQSNRPYTLFYRLPPSAMSQIRLCRFWFLLDRDEEELRKHLLLRLISSGKLAS